MRPEASETSMSRMAGWPASVALVLTGALGLLPLDRMGRGGQACYGAALGGSLGIFAAGSTLIGGAGGGMGGVTMPATVTALMAMHWAALGAVVALFTRPGSSPAQSFSGVDGTLQILAGPLYCSALCCGTGCGVLHMNMAAGLGPCRILCALGTGGAFCCQS